MAGLFGLFDYSKEGPGIDKNAPKKKGFVVFFETFFRNFWKFIPINLMFSLIGLPVLTNGLSYIGFTNVARNTARDKHSFGLSDFFDTIKKNWKQGLTLGIINVIVMAFIAFDIWFFSFQDGILSAIGIGISLAVLIIFSFMKYYVWTLCITFGFTISRIMKNSFKFAFINLWKNLLVCAVLLVCYAIGAIILYYLPLDVALIIVLLLGVCIFPGFKCLLVQFCVFDSIVKYIIAPYYEQHPDDDIELRRSLGLPIPNEFNYFDSEFDDALTNEETIK